MLPCFAHAVRLLEAKLLLLLPNSFLASPMHLEGEAGAGFLEFLVNEDNTEESIAGPAVLLKSCDFLGAMLTQKFGHQ